MANYFDRYTPEYHDHLRDSRKHDWRPSDDVPLCAQAAPLSTAMDIVVLVKAMPNYENAAKLVEQYAAMVAAIAREDDARVLVANLNAPLQRKEPA